ncbi:MAG: translation initiation factor eIF-2B subunit alpha [Chaenotheca gracillima]|nr:MAG: translation initiation factor eIF-2B subunit alpha [Chaenotheca gracillima]
MGEKRIVVVGAGVAGLTTALLLSKNPAYKVTIVAKHMPGDYDIEYASPWAGANYMPCVYLRALGPMHGHGTDGRFSVSITGTEAAEWDKNTWPELNRLAADVPEAGVHYQDTVIYNRKKDTQSATASWFAELLSTTPWFKDTVPNFQEIPQKALPIGIDNATTFTSVCINTAIYLPWLAGQCLKNGAVIKRAVLKHICDAADLHHTGARADLVLNCTGLNASSLGGVEDKNVIPARGQIVVVRNEPGLMTSISGTDDGEDETTYIMQRAAGGGTILGGCYQKGNWDSQPDPNLAVRIMKRCVELCPALTGGKGIEALSVVRHGVGLRPLRLGGVRLERENINGVSTVHNYGHGGFGYQASYGCSLKAVELVEAALAETDSRAKL